MMEKRWQKKNHVIIGYRTNWNAQNVIVLQWPAEKKKKKKFEWRSKTRFYTPYSSPYTQLVHFTTYECV